MAYIHIRYTRAVAFAAVLAASAIFTTRADTIIFHNGNHLEKCKVAELTDTSVVVLLDGGKMGRIVLKRDTVAEIEYDYDSQLEQLEDDDYAGHYDLALWCMERELYKEAITRLHYVLGGEGDDNPGWEDAPVEANFLLGQAYERDLDPLPTSASERYRAFMVAVGAMAEEDVSEELALKFTEAEAGVQRLAKYIPPDPEPGEGPTPTGPKDGFEVGAWGQPNPLWGNRAEIAVIRDEVNGGRVLQATCKARGAEGKPEDKTALMLALNGNDRDATGTPVISVDICNMGKDPVAIAVAVQVDPGFIWYESKIVLIQPAEWTIEAKFDLTKRKWKSKDSGWRYVTDVGNIGAIRNLYLLVYNKGVEREAHFDRIRFVPASVPEP